MLFLQEQLGVCQGTKRIRYLTFFAMYISVMAIPKLSFGYRNQNELISSMAELIFVSNIVCGTMMLWLQCPRYAKFIYSLRNFANLVYQDGPFSTSAEYLAGFNRRIHRSTNTYCFCVMWLILFYVLAPIGTSFWIYLTSQLSSGLAVVNGTMEELTPIEFRHHMDHRFYGLQHHTYLPHYLIFTACMTPTVLGVAFTVHMKVLTISSCVSYCEVLLRIVAIEIDNLAHVPAESIHSELAHIIHLHERALQCIADLKVILQPIMLLQFVLCVLTWCAFMLYFVIVGHLDVKLINLGILFLVITIETFSSCFFGTRLSAQGEMLVKTIYSSGWENMPDHEVRRAMQIVLMRAQKPVGIMAGKYCFVDMERFQKMVNYSYSCFIVLKDAF
uniref:Uncharacterized protein n=1 Tax=Anopheles albimanus TaxID=7167 RepID=A0A182G030_ANOAL